MKYPSLNFRKNNSEWGVFLIVISSIFYHIPGFNIFASILSSLSILYIFLTRNISYNYTDVLLLLIYLIFLFSQLFNESNNLIYYAVTGAAFLITIPGLRGNPSDSSVPSIIALAILLAVVVAISLDPSRGEAIFGNRNSCVSVALILFIFIFCRKDTGKIVSVSSIALFGMVGIISTSRGALVIIGAFLIYYYILKFGKYFALLCYVILSINLALYFSGSDLHRDAILYIFPEGNFIIFGRDLLSSTGRDQLWTAAISAVNNKWIGNGLGNSAIVIDGYDEVFSPHNMFLRIYVEGGYLFSFFTIFIFVIYYRRMQSQKALALFLAVITRNIFESALPLGLSAQSLAIFLPYIMDSIGAVRKVERTGSTLAQRTTHVALE